MSKIHLQRNKAEQGQKPIALCSTIPHAATVNGRIPRNNRTSYQQMECVIVRMKEFKELADDKRCMHCCEAALIVRNRQRKDKGLRPVSHWDA